MQPYTLMMIRPVNFGFNSQTAVNNAFQQKPAVSDGIPERALAEFEAFVSKLRDQDVNVLVIDDTLTPATPDSIFPNNWISFHAEQTAILYPMFAENRRLERKPEVIEKLTQQFGIEKVIDLSVYEQEDKFLEGTGSLILDRENKVVYACISPRTDRDLIDMFCRGLGYESVVFHAEDENGIPIYHTNVMMCIGDNYAVVCMDSVKSKQENQLLKEALLSAGKEIIDISLNQVNHFAGNMLQVEDKAGQKKLVMSAQAFESLSTKQVETITKFNPIIHSDLQTIEKYGGGSARCMLAEITFK